MTGPKVLRTGTGEAVAVLTDDGAGRVVTSPATLPAGAELVLWQPVAEGLPDAEETVMLGWTPDIALAPEAGWWDGEAWRLCESGGECVVAPTHWATWLEGPKC